MFNVHIYQKRTFSIKSYKHFLTPPDNIRGDNLTELFDPLIDYLAEQRHIREEYDRATTTNSQPHALTQIPAAGNLKERLSQVGAKVKVKWTAEEIGDSGWRAGWFIAYVQAYDLETDTLSLQYPTEPGCTYALELVPFITENKIKIIKDAIH